jgi:hypothetical protein
VLAFCLGVELGHLAVGAPLFGILRAMRAPTGDPAPNLSPGAEAAAAPVTGLVRWASLAVALGGAWYLWLALRAI